MIIRTKKLVTLNVYYFMPDHKNILQNFIWSTEDFVPEIPRIHKFLNYWKENIPAVIQEVSIAYENSLNPYNRIRMADCEYRLN
jgi:uncharacterized protein Usg